MLIGDLHCDTVSEILRKDEVLYENSCHVDLLRMKKVFCIFQSFALYPGQKNALINCLIMADKFFTEYYKNKGDLHLVLSSEDVDYSLDSGKTACLLMIEGGEVLQGSLAVLRILHRLGVRCMTLTWNYKNDIACGALHSGRDTGLSDFGADVVSEMNDLGIIIDVSHLSDKSFWEVCELSHVPVAATHSNSRALCSHKRNLTDEQIRFIIKSRGIIGLNFFPDFLGGDGGITEILRHIEHILSLGGEDSLGFGSDFDGVSRLGSGIHGVQSFPDVVLALRRASYSDRIIEKICFKNIVSYIKRVLH